MALPRSFGELPPLPNVGSVHQTPASLMIDLHYANLRLIERWDWGRYARFCQFLKMTPFEVASLVMLRHDGVDDFRRNARISIKNPRPVALLLTLVEAYVCAGWTDDVIKQPFPDLSKT